jgi:hypothetical protein
MVTGFSTGQVIAFGLEAHIQSISQVESPQKTAKHLGDAVYDIAGYASWAAEDTILIDVGILVSVYTEPDSLGLLPGAHPVGIKARIELSIDRSFYSWQDTRIARETSLVYLWRIGAIIKLTAPYAHVTDNYGHGKIVIDSSSLTREYVSSTESSTSHQSELVLDDIGGTLARPTIRPPYFLDYILHCYRA